MCASAGAADAQPDRAAPRAADRGLRAGSPGVRPRRISAELAREKWGGLRISEHGVWRVLVRLGLNTRAKRLALVARHRDPYDRVPSPRTAFTRRTNWLENAIHDRVCDDAQALRWLQRRAAKDWVALYHDLASSADTAGIG